MAPNTKRWRLNNFTAGIDRTDGRVTDQQNRHYDLVNYRISNIKRIRRRPPNRRPGAISNCQGLIAHRGTLYTIAERGATPVLPVIAGANITVVYFDLPDYCTTGVWTLLEAKVFNGSIVAVISHGFPAATVTSRTFTHVFDGKTNLPTYVEDPACPTNWDPALPQNVTGPTTLGAVSAYRPRLTVANGRVWNSRPDGDLGFSGISRARVWNESTTDDLIENGRQFTWVVPAGGPVTHTFITSVSWADYTAGAYYGGVLEYLTVTGGSWVKVIETVVAPTLTPYWIAGSALPAWAASDRLAITFRHNNPAGSLVRFRLALFGPTPIIVVPPAPVLSVDLWGTFAVGTGGSWSGNGSGTIEAFNNPPAAGALVSTGYNIFDNNGDTGGPGHTRVFYFGHGNGEIPQNRTAGNIPKRGSFVEKTLPVGTDGKSKRITKKMTATLMVFGFSGMVWNGVNTLCDFTFAVTAGDYLILTGPAGWYRYRAGSSGTTGIIINDYLNAPGNFTANHTGSGGAFSTGTGVTVVDFVYPYEIPTGKAYYDQIKTTFQLDHVGADDAGVLPTAAQPSAGGSIITALSALKDRLLVCYRSGSQLWLIPPTVSQHQIIDSGQVGTGEQVVPWPENVLGVVVLAMARGLRGQGLGGQDLQSLRDQNMGEPIQALGYPQQRGATYWAHLGAYITAVSLDGVEQFLALDLSHENKIRAWGRWTVAGLPAVEQNSLIALDRRLYFRAGGQVYFFDDADTVYQDDTDVPGTPFKSRAKWHFNDLKEPYRLKHVCLVEAAHTGVAYLEIFQDARNPEQGNGEVIMPDTLNSRSVPAVALGHAIAIAIRSQDIAGHEIEEIGLHYRVLGRG